MLKAASDWSYELKETVKNKQFKWLFRINIDADCAGSSINKAKEWCKKLGKPEEFKVA